VSAGPRPRAEARVGLSSGVLLGALLVFALTTELPWDLAVFVAASGGAAAVSLRVASGGRRSGTAVLIVLLDLGILAAAAPNSWPAGLAGGVAVLGLLGWLADEPGRVTGAMRRAVPSLAVTGLAFGVAWVSAFLLPATQVPTGVVGALLVAVLLLATALLTRPEALEQEPPLAS